MTERLTAVERACVLRAIRIERDRLREERDTLVLSALPMSVEQRRRLEELEAEINCLVRAVAAIWRAS